VVFGLTGPSGVVAGSIVEMLTGLRPPSSGASNTLDTTTEKFSPTEFAMSATSSGSSPVTSTLMSTVSVGELAEIMPASSPGVISRSRSSITLSMTTALSMAST